MDKDNKKSESDKEKDEIVVKKTTKTEPEEDLRELLEKNLKWSQIIYEQTRRLNRRLFWNSVFGWFKLIIIVAPLVGGIWYFWPTIKNVQQQYLEIMDLFGGANTLTEGGKLQMDNSTMDKLLKILPLNAGMEEQFKAIIK